MKNVWTTFFIILVIALMVGCSSDNDGEIEVGEAKEPEVSNDDEALSLDENNASTPDQKNEAADLEEVEKVEEVEAVEEVKETQPRYALQSDNSVKPIDETDSDRVVLLTIDDAPENYGVEMAELLKENDINAIFFVNGHFISNEEGREKLQKIYDLGFEIGNHTMSHPNLSKISEEKQRQEIIDLNDLIEEITGERPRFFRAPFGVNTDVSDQIVLDENMQAMNWTYGYDYFAPYMNAEALITAMVTGEGPEVGVSYSLLKPGANLLMHDRKWTLEALPEIISGLKEKDYQFVDPKTIQ
ncbi:polysaccharide deacetylase family protein [Bacillaceae bacterium IKA-2]|jgi:peptidoglycan/xylan/chitin deacetylase (PgdA/CDA1 family)|nr:polysaccharide deacetylase family protein [Bacillaceae bacterium IKA-2]